MRAELITPTSALQRTFSQVRSVRAASETGIWEVFSGHVPFFATGTASPLHIFGQDGREEIFLLFRPAYRVWQDEHAETVVTITAQQAFVKEVGVHLSLQAYAERVRDMLSQDGVSSHEKVFLEEELLVAGKFALHPEK